MFLEVELFVEFGDVVFVKEELFVEFVVLVILPVVLVSVELL